jgi:hypothetical protein
MAPSLGLAESRTGDQNLAHHTRVNLFIVGADDAVAQTVASLWPHLAAPIVVRNPGERLRLSPASPRVGTMIVHDVDTLTPQEQHTLLQWVGAGNGRTRIVSTASGSVFPKVETGAFNDHLYYRLNVMTLDLTPHALES